MRPGGADRRAPSRVGRWRLKKAVISTLPRPGSHCKSTRWFNGDWESPRKVPYVELCSIPDLELPRPFDDSIVRVGNNWLAYSRGQTWGYFPTRSVAVNFIAAKN